MPLSSNKKKGAAAAAPTATAKGVKNLKQGSLFSFFAKSSSKPATTKPAAAAAAKQKSSPASSATQTVSTTAASSSSNDNNRQKKQDPPAKKSPPSSNNANASTNNKRLQHVVPNVTRVAIFWADDGQYYACDVLKQQDATNFHVRYDDGEEEEWVDFSLEKWKFIDEHEHLNEADSSKKRRRQQIQESDDDDDEEEQEWNDNGDDDDLEKEEDEDNWMVTDDEDDEGIAGGSKKKKKSTKKKAAADTTPPPAAKRTKTTADSSVQPKQKSASTATANPYKTPLKLFAHTVSPKTASSHKSTTNTASKPAAASTTASTNSAAKLFSSQQQSTTTLTTTHNNTSIPKPIPKIVNVRGSHVHNHLEFLRNPKDANGRSPNDPGYDCRTLKVREADWIKHNGSKMTEAVRQWWNLKSQYFDTVLLFKTGKFYELFHMDADIGVEVLGIKYMKGICAHAGFPEKAYGGKADALVLAGYKVARVEQTETPDQLKIRKSRAPRGKAPKVVNREVCSIMSLGTRTFCELDEIKAVAEEIGGSAAEGLGPLLTICETVLSNDEDAMDVSENGDDDNVQPVCEYGITMIDAIRGTVTLGMFADDVLRSRMQTLLASFAPCEILVQGSSNDQQGASPTLMSLLKAYQNSSRSSCRIETIHQQESFPKSTALEKEHRQQLDRPRSVVKPWDAEETLNELHRKRYYPRGSRQAGNKSIARWPPVLKAVVEGEATLCLSSFGAALFFLQRCLIDREILTMGLVKAYIPATTKQHVSQSSQSFAANQASQEQQRSSADQGTPVAHDADDNPLHQVPQPTFDSANGEDQIKYMSLDGTTLHNLEILTNCVDFKASGSLWSKLNHTKSPHGNRMLRAWLLRPLFKKADIDRRADAVQALVGGSGALAMKEARTNVFAKVGDLDRLINRVHSMSVGVSRGNVEEEEDEDDDGVAAHPNDRAVLYEVPSYTKRKVEDFSKLLKGLRTACQIPEIFGDMELDPNGYLFKLVRMSKDGGLYPDMEESLDWYFENFDCDKAKQGSYEPARGCDPVFDQACDTVQRVKEDLNAYREDMCKELSPRHIARQQWKYINTKVDSKEKYLIELPVSVEVPADFLVKGKKGSGAKQVNKYSTPVVVELVKELERAQEVQQTRKALGMQLIFARFDSQRALWSAAANVTAVLDALGSLAMMAANPGYCRAEILECEPDAQPCINIVQGRHPVVEKSFQSTDFIPNDLRLGPQRDGDGDAARLLLLSGPNMGGKSTTLRQTCLIAILAQIGSYVPAESCQLTPVDCIFTRLGASDRILLGQSTFFVELAETAAALRGATRRSLVIMDELGRGTSTFDGTAIASATVKHLVERSRCISLFATHYHSLLTEWKDAPHVRLGHMECVADEDSAVGSGNSNITFLYTLGPGACPKSFGINVAKLAGLPEEVLTNAKKASEAFEEEMNEAPSETLARMDDVDAKVHVETMMACLQDGNASDLQDLWQQLQS